MIEAGEDRGWVSKPLRQRAPCSRARGNLRDLLGIALNIPVGWVVRAIVHLEREAAGPANDACGLPSANQFVHQMAGAGEVFPAGANRQVPDKIAVDLVSHIVIRWPIQ